MKTTRRPQSGPATSPVSDSLRVRRHRTATGEGRPLPADVRAEWEARFGHDFGHVRVHTDAAAAAAASAVDARAYTVGVDVAFAAGQYAPESAAGRELIAHELAHVVQQARGGSTPDAEARADAGAARALRGGTVDAASLGGAPASVQMKPDEAAAAPEPDVITGAGPRAAPTATVLDGFVRDKAKLTKKHRAAIEQLAFAIWRELSPYADAKATIAISGHTDTTGSEKHNSGLSTARADNAKAALEAALAKQGIDPARLGFTTTAHGETQLRVPTADEVDEPGNRRVEIEVTIAVKAPPPSPEADPGKRPPLPGTPGGPKIWEVPGLMEELDPARPPTIPRAPKSKGEWLEEALKRDPLLRKLPKWAREKAVDALKDADEKAADAIIDAIPFGDDEYKQAAKAAMKALLQTLKGRKFKPPPTPPGSLPELPPPPGFDKAPGEKIFKLPAIPF
jgi:outer membrane protein OmpA-like peptidoglycan-associated protein